MARVAVVGGGLGGTATAARLAKLGHEVVLLERRGRIGGAIGFLERDGYRWDTGPTSTALPAVLRDLFRKTGRPLERELELVPVEPMREHRFDDGSVLALPSGSRAAQSEAVDAALGSGLGRQWLDYTHSFADPWAMLRREFLERPWSPEHADRAARDLLRSRRSLHRTVRRGLSDQRLRLLALTPALLDGQDPRNVPAWVGVQAYLEQNFGVWTVRGGMGTLAAVLEKRLGERRVDVRTGTEVRDVAVRDGEAVGVDTDDGRLDADVVVCAVDPRRLPALEGFVRRTMPALPPVVCHLGLDGPVPDLARETVLHGDPTLVVRTDGGNGEGRHAWTVLARGRISEDPVTALARRGVDVRDALRVRVDRSPRDLVEEWGGSPYGVLWQGPATLRHRLSTRTPLRNVLCAGAHVSPGAGVPFVGLGAALVAEEVGKA